MTSIQSQIAALQAELAQLQRQRVAAQVESAKSYADAFIRKLEADRIPLAVGLKAFKDLIKVSVPKPAAIRTSALR